MKPTKKLVALLALLLMVILAVPTIALTAIYADGNETEAASSTSIDLYLIGGQSNASGTSKIASADAAYALAPELKNGFSHVLYAGKGTLSGTYPYDWQPTKLGMGKDPEHLGPEAGMAVALSKYYNAETGKIAGILKYAHGGSKLSGNDTDNANWVSPSYAEAFGWTHGENNCGVHYNEFLKVFKEKVQALVDAGYTDINIKGMYWMQGEGDRNDTNPEEASKYYGTALKYLVSDLRADLAKIMNEVYVTDDGGAVNMPFYVGAISESYLLNLADRQDNNKKFIEVQKATVDEISNCYFIDNSQYKISEYDADNKTAIALGSDTGHWSQADMLTIGQTVGFDMYNYGVIPDEYASTSTYPFVVFNEGTFVGADNTWAKANNLARVALDAAPGSTVSIFMRANATANSIAHDKNTGVSDRIAFMKGTVVVDLGGNTLTSSNTVFEGGTANYTGNYDTTYKVQNGTVLVGKGFVFATESRCNYDKKMDIVFDNINFNTNPSLIEANNRNKMFLSYSDSANYTGKLELSLTFNNCKMNLSGFSDEYSYTVFNFPSTPDDVAVDIRFNGGEIIGDSSLDSITLANIDGNDTLVFGKNASGNYTTLTVPADYTLPLIEGVNDEGFDVIFGGQGKANGDYITYQLFAERNTEYGIIPETYKDYTKYPFAMFVDGEFKSVATDWSGVLNQAHTYLTSNPGKAVDILMRANANGTWNPLKLGHVTGTINIDLGGYSITRTNWSLLEASTNDYTDSSSVLHTMDDAKSAVAANIVVKNGTILANGSILAYQVYNKYAKTINVTFDTVKFALAKTAVSQISVSWAAQNNGTGVITSDLNFKNCTFDFTDIVPENTLYLSDFARGASSHKINVTFDGGSIKGTVSKIKPYSIGANDTVKFINSGNGYTEYVASAGTPITNAITTDKGTMYFDKDPMEAVSGYTVYKLGVNLSGYGTIPAEYYYNTSDYPFVAAKSGEFIGAGKWAAINNVARKALDTDNGATVNILMRANTTANAIATEDRICFMNGTVVVDLGGKTLTSSNTVFEGGTKTYAGNYDSTYIVKNGTVLCGKGIIFATESRSNYDKKMDLVFDSVTFDIDPKLIVADKTRNQMFLSYTDQLDYTGLLDLSLTFNNCVIDLRGLTISYTVFNFPKTPDDVAVDIAFNGGNILGDESFANVKLATIDANDTLVFGKYNGAYTTLTLPEGVNAPTNTFDTKEKYKAVFTKNGGVYTLLPAELKIIGAYLNITENINVCYAVVLPTDYTTPYMVFEFNGNTYTVNDYTEKDGKLIFKFLGVVPQMIGENIKATVYASKGDETYSDAVENYSVRTYCVNMLPDADAKLKTLLSDLLVYGAKAQLYNNPNLAESELVTYGLELTPSEFIAPETSDKKLNGTADDSVVWNSVALRYENAMAIKLNFKVSADYTLKISINGRTVEYKVSDLAKEGDNYVVYFRGIEATEYAMVVTATFYNAEGTQVGQSAQYSVNSYVFSKQNDTDKALSELVKATYNYGVSAENYVK